MAPRNSGRQIATASCPANCASVMSSSPRRIAPLIRCQALPVRHTLSMSHALWLPLHSVIATGPSIASMIEAALIAFDARASRYPPWAPRAEVTSPARCRLFSSLLTVGPASRVRSATWLAVWC
jgi:hypothetical protein